MPTSLFKLFITFFRIGLFTFGGGYAMIPLLERDVVQRNSWLSPEEFTDLLALAQSAPGVFAVNMAVFVDSHRFQAHPSTKSALFVDKHINFTTLSMKTKDFMNRAQR